MTVLFSACKSSLDSAGFRPVNFGSDAYALTDVSASFSLAWLDGIALPG